MSFSTDTIAALATPVGTSAIAVVRASGPAAARLVGEIFKETPLPRQARHADYRDRAGGLVDDVLFTYFAAPHSFTGEDALEISCHGNPFIARKILDDLLARGCRPAEAGEFSKRAFLSGRLDLSQAEAIMDLIHARSERALAAANQQLRGSLGRKMDRLISTLLAVLANIEAYIDFPDEDLPAEDHAALLAKLDGLLADTARLLATSHYGELLREGIKTVIVGEPNAGKSSLLNRLLDEERALVSPEPGTTRDYIEERLMIGAHGLRLIDTAGLNLMPGALEKRGIDKTLEQAAQADLFLWVVDATRPVPALPEALSARLTPDNTILVLNKMDLATAPFVGCELASQRGATSAPPTQPQIGSCPKIEMHSATGELPYPFKQIRVSAMTGEGSDALTAAISDLADRLQGEVGDELIAINARHMHALAQARENLMAGRDKLAQKEHSELVSSELRGALDAYGQISGKIDNEKMLDQLFASFCIGK